MAATAFPALTLRELLWDIPMPVTGWLVAQALRKAGVKGIERDDENCRIAKRLKEMLSNKE